jgi:hypothetical protein
MGVTMMDRIVGTVIRGLRTPIIHEKDDLKDIVVNTVLNASKSEGFSIKDKDIIGITESIVARAQGNYVDIDTIAYDVAGKFGDDTVGVIFPIYSRNRFAVCLKGIAKGVKKMVLMLNYPADEVGNPLFNVDLVDDKGVNPWTDTFTEKEFRELFGYNKHPFTGIDYVTQYKDIINEYCDQCEIVFSNNPLTILKYTKSVLTCDIHSRERTKRILKANGAQRVFGLDNIMSAPINGSGYNSEYGLMGSNKATETRVKLFPRDCQSLVDGIQKEIKEKTGKVIEALVYGDGAFKDPVGQIWELADPVVAPAYTSGLIGTPNEVKIKYLADNEFADLRGEELQKALFEYIKHKEANLVGSMIAQGTTPRRFTDLIGSLCDLTSGSGDKGTPIIYIQGYFDNYAV